MNKILILFTAVLIANSSQATACGDYGQIQLKWKNVPAQNLRNLTLETYQYYLDEEGKEIRHGFGWQFDGAGNLIAHARYVDGKVWSGSVAHVFLSCGIGASRSHFVDGKELRREILDGKLLLEEDTIGFMVDPAQIIGIPASDLTIVQASKLNRR